MNSVMKFLRDEEGATAVEYGLIVGLIAVGLIVAFTLLGGGLDTLFTTAGNEVTDAAAP